MTDPDVHLVDEEALAERIVRGAIRAYRLYAFEMVDAVVVADTCGVRPEDVDRLFPSWDGLLLVTYDRWIQLRGTGRSTPATTVDHVRTTLAEDVADPGLVRLMADVLTIAAADGDFAELFRKRFEEFVEELTRGLEADVRAGTERLGIPAHQAATQLLAVYEGLQIQMLVRPYLDVLVEYDRSVRTLRLGWREQETAAWDLDEVAVR
ncbi:TetR family transcriptional regulator C-terminal domain-containing protein [Curtobacterium citreum]